MVFIDEGFLRAFFDGSGGGFLMVLLYLLSPHEMTLSKAISLLILAAESPPPDA